MPIKSFTCITLKKDEYKKIKALADAMGVSTRVLVNMAINNYVTARYSLTPKLQLIIINLKHIQNQLQLLKQKLIKAKVDEYRINEVDNIICNLNNLLKQIEELEKQVQQ